MTAMSLVLLAHCASGNDEAVTEETDSYGSATLPPDSLCYVQPGWFPHAQTPAPNEGPGSPFADSGTTNQLFHQWSWQKFLWLTKPVNGNPLFLNQQQVMQVTSGMALVSIPAGALVVLEDTKQAGSDQSILQTNPDYNGGTGATVYFSIHMNRKMYQAGVQYAQQISSGQLADSNAASFPVGSFELKVAWVPLSAIPASRQGNFYTTTASLSADGGTTFTNTPVALIGMHVVGVVENHPEFIWATFEHDDLAPNYDWSANTASATTDKLLFKQGSVSGINGIVYNTATQLGTAPYQVFDLFQYGVPRNPDGSFMTTSQSEPENFNNIQGINQCVKSRLNDVWNNYFYNGSIWLNMDGKTPQQQTALINSLGYSIGSATPGSSARGSLNCSNVTMETFTQTFQTNISGINVNTLASCFSCHASPTFKSGSTARSPLYLSHVFQGYLLNQQGSTGKQVESIKLESERRLKKTMLAK